MWVLGRGSEERRRGGGDGRGEEERRWGEGFIPTLIRDHNYV